MVTRILGVSTLFTRSAETLAERTDLVRLDAVRALDPGRRATLGQYMTPAPVARFMASLLRLDRTPVRALDAGAGVGSLTSALVEELCARDHHPDTLHVEAWEIDPTLARHLRETLGRCEAHCARESVRFDAKVHQEDFLDAGVSMLERGLFARERSTFNAAILNPPYHKINADSAARRAVRRLGVETSNLYTAFLAVAIDLLEPGGELVAITPRSFCNGPYFRPFRERFLATMALTRMHVFVRRDRAFEDDDVLQETVIFHAVKGMPQRDVVLSSSEHPDDLCPFVREVPFTDVVRPDDPERIFHLVTDGLGVAVNTRMERLPTTLADLGVQVSTGRVVDFRARDHLRAMPERDTVPLVYPLHLSKGTVEWPRSAGKKPQAIRACAETAGLLLPSGFYVATKRFSSKEEPRRIVAALYDPDSIPADRVGFENHLNVFHQDGHGLPERLARGLVAWLNSTLVDEHFRSWSGHTQVNATDLRKMRWPTRAELEALGHAMTPLPDTQEALDRAVERVLFPMTDDPKRDADPIVARRRIDEALGVLKDLGLPKEQVNERSALTLLALLDLRPSQAWPESSAPLRGITPMMEFFAEHYGKRYAPNTRETVRRFTVHQFVEAGLLVENPDEPTRPTNSPRAVYQVAPMLLELARARGTPQWDAKLAAWHAKVESLTQRYARERTMNRIPVTLAPGTEITLSAGGQNPLVKLVIDEFCPRFTPGGKVLYVGDTGDKWAYFDRESLAALGVKVDKHGKMPDVVVHFTKFNWLVLIEAVTSHGPVNAKRRGELAELFKGSTAGLVYVTAFADRRAMTRYLGEISWETEVWVADAPSHMIHFNGERFLGPH